MGAHTQHIQFNEDQYLTMQKKAFIWGEALFEMTSFEKKKGLDAPLKAFQLFCFNSCHHEQMVF